MTEFNPRVPIYDPNNSLSWWVTFMFWASVVLLAATAIVVGIALLFFREHARVAIFSLAAAWALGAPVWFFAEYFWLYRKASAPGSWELFKHGQQLAVAIWAGVTVSLYALASSDLAKPKEDAYECVPHPSGGAPNSLLLVCKPSAG